MAKKIKPIDQDVIDVINQQIQDNDFNVVQVSLGAPPMYKEPQDLLVKIDEYFKDGITAKKVIIGKGENKEIVEIEVPTITGLCHFAGFESRQSFYDYGKKEAFSYIIKRAQLFIEKHYEELLQVGNTTGAIFALKNMGWIDKIETDNKTTLTTTGVNIIFSDDENESD